MGNPFFLLCWHWSRDFLPRRPSFLRHFLLQPAPFGDVVGDPHRLELLKVGKLLRGDFVELKGLVSSKKNNFLRVVQPEQFVRQHEGALGVGTGLAVWPGAVKDGRE